MGVRFKNGSPEQLFLALERKHHAAVDNLLAKNGVSGIGQPMILCILSQQTSGIIESQRALANRLRVSPSTMTVSLKSMERDGYVKKLSNSADLRRKPICITEKGKQAAKRINQVFETLDHSMYQGFSRSEREQIASLYRRMIDNLDAVGSTSFERQEETVICSDN